MIRAYHERDLDRVVRVWYEASRLATPFLSEAFLEEEEAQIRTNWMPVAESWVWEEDGEVLGFIALVGDEVGGIFVDPRSQGKGIGRALMDHAVSLRGRLVLNVFEENRIGRRFYDRYGFRQIGEVVHEPTGRTELRLEYRG